MYIFYGKKDNTLSATQKGSKISKTIIKEEHYTILGEPGSKYLGHVTPKSGAAESISNKIIDFLGDNVSEIEAIGCDGTVINTGRKHGVIARVEQVLGRPVRWLVCPLHANEIPLRHLIMALDGKSTGPSSFMLSGFNIHLTGILY